MALFVDLGEDDSEPPHDFQAGKPIWKAEPDVVVHEKGDGAAAVQQEPDLDVDGPNRNSTTKALGCYPIIVAIAAHLDLNSLDNLSRTCRQVHQDLLQYRKILQMSSLRCINETLPIDPDETFRYRTRVGNWAYMEDTSRTSVNIKASCCARDLVSECRRCGTIVCRNCAIKPPAPVVLRDRHRRLCKACTKAHITELVKPALQPTTPLQSEIMETKICCCATDGVWLCQPCGRTIRGADYDYQAIWRWRIQYGERLGGLGTGIGDGDRGVPCGRESECHGAKGCEHETDCDAADAAADNYFFTQQQGHQAGSPHSPQNNNHTLHHAPSLTWTSGGSSSGIGTPDSIRSSSGGSKSPGYARHEIEGIGGVVKTKLVRMVKVGAGVPDWEDEVARGQILGREVSGRVRSWCGWCHRVIPGQQDVERDRQQRQETSEQGKQEREWQNTSPSYSSSLALRSRGFGSGK